MSVRVPALEVRRQRRLIGLLKEVARQPLDMDWDCVVSLQGTYSRGVDPARHR